MFRCMPNTPVVVRNGVSIYSRGTHVGPEDEQLLSNILNSLGLGIEMEEHYMDIMTALTGCGPTYVSDSDQPQTHEANMGDICIEMVG